jgi:hypothetical protein
MTPHREIIRHRYTILLAEQSYQSTSAGSKIDERAVQAISVPASAGSGIDRRFIDFAFVSRTQGRLTDGDDTKPFESTI